MLICIRRGHQLVAEIVPMACQLESCLNVVPMEIKALSAALQIHLKIYMSTYQTLVEDVLASRMRL